MKTEQETLEQKIERAIAFLADESPRVKVGVFVDAEEAQQLADALSIHEIVNRREQAGS